MILKVKRLLECVSGDTDVIFALKDGDIIARLNTNILLPLHERFESEYFIYNRRLCYFDLIKCNVLLVAPLSYHEILIVVSDNGLRK